MNSLSVVEVFQVFNHFLMSFFADSLSERELSIKLFYEVWELRIEKRIIWFIVEED